MRFGSGSSWAVGGMRLTAALAHWSKNHIRMTERTMHIYALTEYSSRGITPIFLTQPLPRAALWTMATSNQRLDQI